MELNFFELDGRYFSSGIVLRGSRASVQIKGDMNVTAERSVNSGESWVAIPDWSSAVVTEGAFTITGGVCGDMVRIVSDNKPIKAWVRQ
ncbi:MAG: hypothetical protein ACRCZM_11875 [Bacteroidales bacterium]